MQFKAFAVNGRWITCASSPKKKLLLYKNLQAFEPTWWKALWLTDMIQLFIFIKWTNIFKNPNFDLSFQIR